LTQLVQDLMHPGLITCDHSATLGQVAVMLSQHHIHALYVTDAHKRVTGVITDFDLLAGEWLSSDEASFAAMKSMTAGELMSSPPLTIDASAPITEAAATMKDSKFKRLLVVKDGKDTGVLSVSDLVASIAGTASLNRSTVADVMSRVMLVCRKEASVADVARGMTNAGYRSVLVVNRDGGLMGVVSGLDILDGVHDEKLRGKTAEQVMHPALTIKPSASLREAADTMIEHYHHRLIVVDPEDKNAMPVGIVSTVDIVAEMAQPNSVWQTT
jgi:CBS domain-containing protein